MLLRRQHTSFILNTWLPLLRYWYRMSRPTRICTNVLKTELRVLTTTEDSRYNTSSLEHRHSCLHLPSITSTMTSSWFFLREDIKTAAIQKPALWLAKPTLSLYQVTSHLSKQTSCFVLSNQILFGAAVQRRLWRPNSWVFLDHTQRRITLGRTSLDEWSARRRPLPHNKQKSQKTFMPPSGIRSHNLSRRTAADQRLKGPIHPTLNCAV